MKETILYILLAVSIVIVTGIALLFQGNGVALVSNTNNVTYHEHINSVICEVVHSRGIDRYLVCNENKGYFLYTEDNFSKEAETTIRYYIIEGETRLIKRQFSSVILFVNDSDTLKVNYTIDEKSRILINGVVKWLIGMKIVFIYLQR